MDERSKEILRAVIESYINLASPIGSRFLGKHYDLGICPATIRNTMADLNELGFLEQPHTSSGRIPTDRAYKFYVEEILEDKITSDNQFLRILYKNLLDIKDLSDYLLSMAKMIADYTKYIGITLSSGQSDCILDEVEFVKYKDNFIVVVLITKEGIIKHRIVEDSARLSISDLRRISKYLNSQFAGCTLEQIRQALVDDVFVKKSLCDNLIAKALEICADTISSFKVDLNISGVSGILNLPDFGEIEKIKSLASAIEDKATIISLLDKITEGDGIQVLVGAESSLENEDLSLVASALLEGGRRVGVIGLIGPKRMDYLSAIEIVDASVKFLSNQLKKK